MARLIGVDVRNTHVRVVLLRTGRRSTIERMLEADLTAVGTLEDTLRVCVGPLIDSHIDGIAAALDGEQTFIHRLELPSNARKQLAEVLPFEIEAQVPIELDELVFDYRLVQQRDPSNLTVLTAAARIETVRAKIADLAGAFGREPDRVGCGALPLANLGSLCPVLASPEPTAVLDLGGASTDLLVMVDGEPLFARTLTMGMRDLPAGAPRLVADLTQSLLGWAAQWPTPVTRMFLTGSGSADANASAYLSHMLGIPVEILPNPFFSELSDEHAQNLARYAKPVALALSLERGRDLDLRRGPLVTQRRYDFLKERTPLFAGLAAAILISLLFFIWASLRSLNREEAVLSEALATLSKQVLAEETEDPDRVRELIERGKVPLPSDPMPHADAFDVIVKLSELIPMSVGHDVEEFEMARGRVKINGIVDMQADAQRVPTLLKEWQCAKDLKLGKITQVVNDTRQKYTLEFDVRCPEDDTKKLPKKKKEEPAATPESKTP